MTVRGTASRDSGPGVVHVRGTELRGGGDRPALPSLLRRGRPEAPGRPQGRITGWGQ